MPMVWLIGGVAASLFLGIAVYLRGIHPSIARLQLTFTKSAFNSVLAKWSQEDLKRVKTHFIADYVFLCAYAAFGYLLATRAEVFTSVSTRLARVEPWVLPLAAGADLCENLLHQLLLRDTEAVQPGFMYALAGVCATMKWILILAFAAIIIAG